MRLTLYYAVLLYSMIVGVKSNSTMTTDVFSESTGTTATSEVTSPSMSTHSSTSSTKAPTPACWHVTYDNLTEYCISMEAEIVVALTFRKNETKDVRIDRNATASGKCSMTSDSETVTISAGNMSLTWTFVKQGDKYNVTTIDITYGSFKDNGSKIESWLSNIVSSKMYQCNANKKVLQGFLFNGTEQAATFVMTMSHLKLEAFQNSTVPCNFNKSYVSCSDDENVSNLVPIIVGACLVGLIIIVLIAYLVGRRRSRRGYESV